MEKLQIWLKSGNNVSLLEDCVLSLVTLVAAIALSYTEMASGSSFSVRPPAYISSAREGGISVKFCIGGFNETLSRYSKFG